MKTLRWIIGAYAFASIVLFSARSDAAVCARPTDSSGYAGYKYAPVTPSSFDSAHVRIWYTTSGVHAVSTQSSRSDGVPDDVVESAAVAEHAWTQYQAQGYRALPSDAETGCSGYGGDARLDVYLVDFGAADGLTATEGCKAQGDAQVCASFILAESNFAGRYATASVGIRTVLPHELFHAVQNAYDAELDRFWAEGTAQWAAKQLDPSLTDFESYLPSFFSQSSRAIDAPAGGVTAAVLYGSAIWPAFLSLQHGPDIIRQTFEREAVSGGSSLLATDAALLSAGSSLQEAFSLFGAWNAATGERWGAGGYPNAETYPMVAVSEAPAGGSFSGQTSGLGTLYYRLHSDVAERLSASADADRTSVFLLPLRDGRVDLSARKALPTEYVGDAILVVSGGTTSKTDARFTIERRAVLAAPASAPSDDTDSNGCAIGETGPPRTLSVFSVLALICARRRRAENAE